MKSALNSQRIETLNDLDTIDFSSRPYERAE